MNKGKGLFRLILNGKASKEIEWHCKHYVGRGIMKKFGNGAEVARIEAPAAGDLRQVQRRAERNVPFGKVFPQRAA